MKKIEVFKKALIQQIHVDLTGDLEISLNKSHFDLMEKETGLSNRKLKELFGIYNKRSKNCHEYTLSRLAEFAGYKDWNSFLKEKVIELNSKELFKIRKTEMHKKIKLNNVKQKKVQISILIN